MWWWWWWVLAAATLLLAWLLHITVFIKWRGPIYWVRWARLVVRLWLERLSWERRVNNYEFKGTPTYDYCGVEATPSEKELEQPKPLITDRYEDEVCMCGVERGGRVLVARLSRFTKRRASIFLYLKDHDGTIFTLPNQPDTSHINVSSEGWRGAGLTLTPVEPMRNWRLKFNGLMRRGVREQYMTEDEETRGQEAATEGGEEDIVEVRLDMLWRSMAAPVELWEGTSLFLLAHTLAQRPFTSLQALRSEQGDGYEQWGSLHGTVTVGTQAPLVWHLRGPRRHRWGLTPSVGGGKQTYVYFNNGDLLCLRGNFPTHDPTLRSQAGYLQKASGDLFPVTWTDLDPRHIPSDPSLDFKEVKTSLLDPLGHHLLLKFSAGGRKYEMWQKLGERMPYYTGDPWVISHDLYPTTVASNHSYGWGITVFSRGYTDLCPVPERESLPAIEVPRVDLEDGAPLVVTLDDPRCRSVDLAGGKGSSLALLMAYKELLDPDQEEYEVPCGVVVTAAGWQRQLQTHPELLQAVKAVKQAAVLSQPAPLKDACARAVEVCEAVKVCDEVVEAVMAAVEDQWGGIGDCSVAVRSSGCSEDGDEASAAGQNQTFLGVKGKDHLLSALASCWASLFSFHSVEYRRQRGQAVEAGMAVVVQEMVKAEAAGVVFTADPTTGSPATITITVNYGLGESVVSGSSEPDTVVVGRGWRGGMRLTSTTKGAKTTQCVLKEGGGTEEVEVAEVAQKKEVLDQGTSLRLARVADYVQEAFGGPRDIEFALAQDRVFLLQSRPITTQEVWSDWELTHEQDSAVLTDHELLTRANIGEVLPGNNTPLSLSLMPQVLDYNFQKNMTHTHWPAPAPSPHHIRLCPPYNTYIFLNMLEMQYRDTESEEVTVSNQALDLAVHGHRVSRKQYLAWGRERHGTISRYTAVLVFIQLVMDKFASTSRVRKCQQKFGEYKVGIERADTAASLHAELSRRIPEYMEVSNTHISTSTFSSVSQSIAFVTLAQGNKELSDDNRADMATLLSSCTGAESADVPAALKELARVISENEEVEEFLGMTVEEAAVWLQSHPGHLGDTFRAFLHRHGHRGIKELDLGAVPWRIEPQSLVHTLQVMARHPDTRQHSKEPKHPKDLDEIFESLRSQLTHRTKQMLRFVLPMCRQAVVQREATKSVLTKVIDGLREGYRNLGQMMVREGRLPSPDLVFFFKHSELGQLVTSPSPALIAKARRRQRLHSQLNDLQFPEVSVGLPSPVSASECQGATRIQDGMKVVDGTPVCHGQVTALARVVTNLQQAVNIKRGEVLVTTSTDVGWTPYFPLLAGVVTEIGGLISHGAVVAREYGLPCLVGVTGATHIINTGDKIFLNASQGTITIFPQDPE